mgnify:CR=1 FL=1
MGKGKPRQNPDKKQNKYGSFCNYYEEGSKYCETLKDSSICSGNPHNCIKVAYKVAASRSDKQKNNDVGIRYR